jgi:hypothetical protein
LRGWSVVVALVGFGVGVGSYAAAVFGGLAAGVHTGTWTVTTAGDANYVGRKSIRRTLGRSVRGHPVYVVLAVFRISY